MGLYQALKFGAGPVVKALYKPWVEGLENIPDTGAAILASNHNAVWDSVFLPLVKFDGPLPCGTTGK